MTQNKLILAFTLVLSVMTSSLSFASGPGYQGPLNPGIPADNQAVDTSMATCKNDVAGVEGGDADEIAKAADLLCSLRKAHDTAQKRLLADLSKLVATYKDYTNHDHAQNLPSTIQSVQSSVKDCLDALSSQEYCHNLACVTAPETDAAYCDNQAASLVEQMIDTN